MCLTQEDVIRKNIKVMKEELVNLYSEEKDFQKERVQSLSQKIDRLVNALLKESLKDEDNHGLYS